MLLKLKAFWNINKGLKAKVRSGKERAHSAEEMFFPNSLHNFLCCFHATENKCLSTLDDYVDQIFT